MRGDRAVAAAERGPRQGFTTRHVPVGGTDDRFGVVTFSVDD
jgi:hypothetical protein